MGLPRDAGDIELPEGHMVDDEEESLCGALAEMRAIYEQKSRRNLALRLVKTKMRKFGMNAREVAEDIDLDPELADWCVEALSAGEGVEA